MIKKKKKKDIKHMTRNFSRDIKNCQHASFSLQYPNKNLQVQNNPQNQITNKLKVDNPVVIKILKEPLPTIKPHY